MKIYNPTAACPKCGHRWVSSRYVTFAGGLAEAIRRVCERCGYTWNEGTL